MAKAKAESAVKGAGTPLERATEKGFIGVRPDEADYSLTGAISQGKEPDPAYAEMTETMEEAEASLGGDETDK